MRMRIKAWAEPELLQCPFYAADPKAYRGRWAELFGKNVAKFHGLITEDILSAGPKA